MLFRDKTIARIWGKSEYQHSLCNYMYSNCIFNSNDLYFAYKFSGNFIREQLLDQLISKFFWKSVTTAPLVKQFSPKVDIHQFMLKLLNVKFHENLWNSSEAIFATKFLSLTDRHFPEILKLYSGHLKKHVNLSKTGSHEFSWNQYLSSVYR